MMTRTEKILVGSILLFVYMLIVPVANVPQFMLAEPPSIDPSQSGDVVVFVSQSNLNPDGDRLDVQLTVINKTGRRVYFYGQSPGFGSIFPAYTKDALHDQGFGHCGNCWEEHSLMSGFGTTFKATLHPAEEQARYGFIYRYNESDPDAQISWSETLVFPEQ